ncbi:MAG: hypothetical protein EOO17_03135 [Chloroflexi bacterium]|nr:MAG: hypothetical protein EOO17_03135 [Chloroflexota bacterium]
MQAPFVIERLVNMGVIVDDIHVVVVDAPWGGKTLVQGVSKVTPFVNFLHPVTRFIPVPVQEGGLPKRESITIPATSDQRLRVSFGNAETEERYADWVVETARRSLSGYRFSQLIGQTAWMKRCARNGSLERAVQSLRGLRVTYIACVDSSNDVVRQPMAVDLWSKQLPDMQVIEVATPHCAFLQSQPIFEPVIADLLNVWK